MAADGASRRAGPFSEQRLALALARHQLSRFIETVAQETAGRLGFAWIGSADAPGRYGALQAAFDWSSRTGDPLPVSDQHTDPVIYDDQRVNLALRFWHDVSHVEQGLSFVAVDELELARCQLQVLARAGFPPESLVWRLLEADLIGQTYLSAVCGDFPINQERFVLQVVQHGLTDAVVAETRQIEEARRAASGRPS